jgi:hypothetical protein
MPDRSDLIVAAAAEIATTEIAAVAAIRSILVAGVKAALLIVGRD